MKKISLSLLTLVLSSQAMAADLVCSLKETLNGNLTKLTEVRPTDGGAHGTTNWENDFATGFVALSNGYTVVTVVTKADGRVFSFYGSNENGKFLNGSTCLADHGTCLTVTCK